MKKTLKNVVMGVLAAGTVLSVSAYSTQIWSPVQFVKQLFVTPNGETDMSKATIKIDGINGEIDAKKVIVAGEDVKAKADSAYTLAKAGGNLLLANAKCDKDNVGKLNVDGKVCTESVRTVCTKRVFFRCRRIEQRKYYKWVNKLSTVNYVNSKVSSAYSLAKKAYDKAGNSNSNYVRVCNAANAGKHNSSGWVCVNTNCYYISQDWGYLGQKDLICQGNYGWKFLAP